MIGLLTHSLDLVPSVSVDAIRFVSSAFLVVCAAHLRIYDLRLGLSSIRLLARGTPRADLSTLASTSKESSLMSHLSLTLSSTGPASAIPPRLRFRSVAVHHDQPNIIVTGTSEVCFDLHMK